MLVSHYPMLTENVEIIYTIYDNSPQSRPFFSLSLDDTSSLLLTLVILAHNSEEKGFDETVLDKSTGKKWIFLFQRIEGNLTVRQRIAKALYLIPFQMKKWLTKTSAFGSGMLPTHDDVLRRLLRIMAKEPQDRVSLTLTFIARQEKWKFLFMPISG